MRGVEKKLASGVVMGRLTVMPVKDLNAGDICRYRKMLFTKEALLSVLNAEQAS